MVNNHKYPRWAGVFPALTTKMKPDSSLDIPAMEKHCSWQIASGVDGLVVLGSLGENGVLKPEEKRQIIRIAVAVSNGRVLVLAGVAECSTHRACHL